MGKTPGILQIYKSSLTVFTAKDIAFLLKETKLNTIKAKINYYVKTKKLIPLRKGIYVKDKSYNKLELATKIYTPSYISLETVLYKEGVIFQHYDSIFVVSYLSREITCDNQKYIYKKIKNEILLNPKGIRKEKNYFIATKERALLDALYLYKNYFLTI